ncbi:MAG TPA: chemotaxis protein CheW [Leptospiraceae bacterium]|nr:chemotaxis protein CheW [Leptospiraceae bacterium]HMY65914.1 chemotaxis protein CheW [Leptospiraceae bacterium]HNF13677.1 chemotaxis protein CheW [Leptospiraceae bacterium]HNF25069.1 chemotaxis protein CheW [Leptospiraceae bacterium]HNI25283.1 chemotaxis protein CheW [Leptospiraceae bacterium]
MEETATENQLLTFYCGAEVFAIDILKVKEIKEYTELTSIPLMPKAVQGVINLRGQVLPIIDLNIRFGRPAAKITRRTCIIVVEISGNEEISSIGILVDSVNEVVSVFQNDIEQAPSFGSKIRNDFIQSIAKVNGKFIIILNMEQVLSVEELSRIDEKLKDA